MKRFATTALILITAALLLFGGYQWAVNDGHRDPLPGDVGEPMHVSMAAFERVTGTGVLRCGYYDWPPYIVKGEELSKPTGPIVTLLDQLGATLGLKVEFVESSLGRQYGDLVDGRIDAHCFDAPQSYLHYQRFDMGQALLATPLYTYTAEKSALHMGSPLNVATVRFAAMEGDISLQVKAAQFGLSTLTLIKTGGFASDLFTVVARGDADILVSDALAVAAYNAKNPDKKLRQLSQVSPLLQTRYIMTAKGDPALRAMLDDGLRQIILSGRYAQTLDALDSLGKELYTPTKQLVPFRSR